MPHHAARGPGPNLPLSSPRPSAGPSQRPGGPVPHARPKHCTAAPAPQRRAWRRCALTWRYSTARRLPSSRRRWLQTTPTSPAPRPVGGPAMLAAPHACQRASREAAPAGVPSLLVTLVLLPATWLTACRPACVAVCQGRLTAAWLPAKVLDQVAGTAPCRYSAAGGRVPEAAQLAAHVSWLTLCCAVLCCAVLPGVGGRGVGGGGWRGGLAGAGGGGRGDGQGGRRQQCVRRRHEVYGCC